MLTGLFGRRADDTDGASEAMGGWPPSRVSSQQWDLTWRNQREGLMVAVGGGILWCVVENFVLHSISLSDEAM